MSARHRHCTECLHILEQMAIEVLSDPFANSASLSVSESQVRNASPAMPDTKLQDLLRAAERESFDKQEGINERFLLDKEVLSIASNISAELGPFTLDIYESAQDIVAAGVLRTLNEGDRTGSFRGQNANGGSQWDIQQLTVDSLNDTSNEANPTQYRTYTTVSGDFNIAPSIDAVAGGDERDPSNDVSGDVGANEDGTHSLDDDTQSAFVLGFYQSTNPRVVEQIQVSIDDGETRTPFDAFGHNALGTLQAFDAPSFEYITDDDSFDINGSATSASATDLYPFGIDLNTAANLPSLSTKA